MKTKKKAKVVAVAVLLGVGALMSSCAPYSGGYGSPGCSTCSGH